MPIVLVHLNNDVRERRLLVHDGAALEIRVAGTTDDRMAVITANGNTAQLDNRSELRCLLNGMEVRQAMLTPGDTVQIGKEKYVVEAQLPLTNDTGRSSRRVSASRITAVNTSGRKGFLRRVGRLLQMRNQLATRLRQLEQDRDRLLQDAGRCALRPDAGLGFPEALLGELRAGHGVVVQAGDVGTVHLERWAQFRQQATFIDTEIAALREDLGLGPDPARLSDPPPTLRIDQQLQQDRCFALMDDRDTQQIDSPDRPIALPVQLTAVREADQTRNRSLDR